MLTVYPLGDGFFASTAPNGIGLFFPSREKAQTWCDEVNPKLDIDRRKNAALDWALAGNVTDEELDAAMRTPGSVGLLEFESRMAEPLPPNETTNGSVSQKANHR